MAVSLVLGIVGAATGIGSLAWQLIIWRQGGPIVIADAELGAKDKDYRAIGVIVRNIGRSPISVTGVRVSAKKTGQVIRSNMDLSRTPMPCRLKQGSAEPLIVSVLTKDICDDLVVIVDLADKKEVRTTVPPPPPEQLAILKAVRAAEEGRGSTWRTMRKDE